MTTQELFWKRGVGGYTEQDAVDWALVELELRAPSANLAALAGSIPPYNGFEIEDLLEGALREIGGAEPSREESYRDFVCTMVGRILSNGDEWEATRRAEQQVTAPGCFRRYFQYAVPARDT